MLPVTFLEVAELELDEAVEYYNSEVSGLGLEFLEEVVSCLKRVSSYPEAWSICSSNIRRCLTRRFPYGILYQVRKEEILIVAVMHLHRKPTYWKDRLNQ